MPKWAMATIGNCLERNSLNEFPKLPRRDYKISGNYPVIDQGQSLIGGWTDEGSGLISKNLPVIIFGDHTRALKYIDFPFVRGADGTQVLKPKVGIEPQYFYYACRAINLPSRGYSRHFKTFKEKKISLPPLSYQKRIVADLNKKMATVEKARAATLERVEAIRALPAAFLREVFSFDDGKLPQGWRWAQLGDVCDILDNRRIPVRKSDRSAGPYPYYGATGILDYIDDYIFDESLVLIGEDGAKWESGERTAFIAEGKYWVNNHAHVVKPHAHLLNKFLVSWLTIFDLTPYTSGLTVPKLNQKRLCSIPIPLPPLSEQKRIVTDLNKKMTTVEKALDAAEAESEATHALPAAFLRQAFSGTL